MFYVARNRGLSYTRSPDGGHRRVERNWHLVVGTYDGSSVRLYVDGSQVGNGTAHTGPIDYDFPDNDLFIGHYNTCPAEDFHGRGRFGADLQPCADSQEFAGRMTSSRGPEVAARPAARVRVARRLLSQAAGRPHRLGAPARRRQGSGEPVGYNGRVGLRPVQRQAAPGCPSDCTDGHNPIKPSRSCCRRACTSRRAWHSSASGVLLAHRPKYSLSFAPRQLVIVFKQPQRSEV